MSDKSRIAQRAAWSASLLLAGAASAAAQDVPAGLEEVVVTATKREQAINDVGQSVVALDGDFIANQRISSLSDVTQAVPGLAFAVTNNNTPVLTLRGIGFYDSSIAAYPAVSVYVDEVPLPLPILASRATFDLERIEVMKGPQGTLFGQNSTGGAINYIAAKPSQEFTAGADLTYGRFDTMELNAFVGGSLGATVTARFAGQVVDGDGWQQGYSPGMKGEESGDSESYAGRLQLGWTPRDDVSVLFNVNAWADKSDPTAPQYIWPNPQQPCCGIPEVVAYPLAPRDARAADWSSDTPLRADNRLTQVSLRADVSLPAELTLTSLTSYIDFDLDQTPEGDGTAFHILDVVEHQGTIQSFSQELRLTNDAASDLRWVLGANFEDTDVEETATNNFVDSSTFPALGIWSAGFTSDQAMQNHAGFGHVEYDMGDAVTLKAGARYTKSTRDAVNCAFGADDGATNGFFTFLSGLLSGQDVEPLRPGDCFNMDSEFIAGEPYASSLDEDNTSWRVGLDYRATSDVLLYGNVSKGYKAGSIPTLAAATNTQFAPVVQESVMSYELGVKASPAAWLQVNAAAFYYDYEDKQLKSKVQDPVFGLLDALVNIPKSKVRGAELEVTAAAAADLTFRAAVSYTKAEVEEYTGINAAGVVADFEGASVPFTPEWQAKLVVDKEWTLDESWAVFAGATLTYSDEAVAIVDGENVVLGGNDDLYVLPSYTLFDLRAGFATADERWRVTLWSRNLADEFYVQNASTDSDAIVRYAGRPRTYGITVAYRP
ncbi:MAG TPA: TonB-dependent receptor [Steroidobacteraceae bacterium]|nr:TonB-dependent receptor [Steroidobacteraceae bacterium]